MASACCFFLGAYYNYYLHIGI